MKLEELRKISLLQLEIMDEIHKICEKEKITYYIIGGTLLGAVRHKGFIPWDLDIDIAMSRDQYDKFKVACDAHLREPYVYLDHTIVRNFPRPHALISRSDTRVVTKYDRLNPPLMDLGVYIDIFPLDNAPDDVHLRKAQAKKLTILRKLKSYRLPYSYSYKKWKRYAHYGVSALLSVIPIRRINQWQQNLMKKYRHVETKCFCSMGSRYSYEKQCMDRHIYGQPVLLEFEGRKYCAPEKYKEYLSQLYGDYMQLPPVEKQNANLDYFSALEILQKV